MVMREGGAIEMGVIRRTQLPLWMTITETAELLGVKPGTVERKIREGLIPVSPHGKPYRVDRDGLFRMARDIKDRKEVQVNDTSQISTTRRT